MTGKKNIKKKPDCLNPDDYEPITMEEFEDAIKGVLFKPVKKRAKYENRKPTKEELNKKWKLKKDKAGNWKMKGE